MLFVKKTVALLCLLLLVSCSGTYHAYSDMLKLAFKTTPDVSLPYSALSAAKHDYLYVKRGEQAQVAMALMYIESGQLKWVSADRSLLITDHGRIVRTVGLQNDLLFLSNANTDPLKSALNLPTESRWQRLADWQQGEYGYQLSSTFQYGEAEPMAFLGQQITVIPLTENVHYSNKANFVRLDDKWQNQFWLEAKTGRVLKSRQKLSPDGDQYELIFISEVVRHYRRTGINVAAEAI